MYLATTEHGSIMLLVWPDGAEVITSDFSEADLDRLLVETDPNGETVTGGYLPAQLAMGEWLGPALAKLLPALGMLLAPLADRLRMRNATGVSLVAMGHLALLPLHAARYTRDGVTMALLDEFAVSYAPSAQALAAARQNGGHRAGSVRRLAGVGNPLPNPKPLAYAKPELQSTAELLPADDARALYETDATKAALLEALEFATVAHLACHGQFQPDQPLESGMVLSDDVWTLREVLDQPAALATVKLIVLSACQTAITDFRALPDEAVGLPAGFLQAGVPAVVGTLWSVNDASTALLMVRFYELMILENLTPCEALRQSMGWLRDLSYADLGAYLQHHDRLAQAQRELADRMAAGLTYPLRLQVFTSQDSQAKPFADPRFWAPLTFSGAAEIII